MAERDQLQIVGGALLLIFDTDTGQEDITVWDTMHYTSLFLIGALLVKNKDSLGTLYAKLSKLRKWAVLTAIFPFYAFSTVIASAVSKVGLPYGWS